jgi:hypothetical protein
LRFSQSGKNLDFGHRPPEMRVRQFKRGELDSPRGAKLLELSGSSLSPPMTSRA